LPQGDAIVPNLVVEADALVVVVAALPSLPLELSLPLAAQAPATNVNATTMTANDRFIYFGPFSSESNSNNERMEPQSTAASSSTPQVSDTASEM
jgi:hypothetical protein